MMEKSIGLTTSLVLKTLLICLLVTALNACAIAVREDSAPVAEESAKHVNQGVVTGTSIGLFSNKKNDDQPVTNVFTPVYKPVHGNVFDSMDYIGSEPSDFGLYTYVLFTRPATPGSPLYQKYETVLEQVQQFPNWRRYSKIPMKWKKGGDGQHNINTKGLNIFLVPTRFIPAGQTVTMQEYEFDIASVIVNEMLQDVAGPKFRDKVYGEGPYLFSLKTRLKELDKDFVLYADLSDLGPNNAAEVVSTYQSVLLANEKPHIEPFRFAQSLRSQIGQQFVNSNSIFDQTSPVFAGQ